MKSRRSTPVTSRRLSRSLLLVLAAALPLLAPQASVSTVAPQAADRDSIAGLRPETRLRKLHLVRPDLIPYPIAYEVYC